MNKKIKTIDIEIAIMRHFDFRKNLIVTNITRKFEADVVVLTPSGYAHGFEIKVSLSDLKADFKKPHHDEKLRHIYYQHFKHFSYAVPVELKDKAISLIPDFCGLYVFEKRENIYDFSFTSCKEVRRPKKLYDYKWSEKDRLWMARLGAIRVYFLKGKLNK